MKTEAFNIRYKIAAEHLPKDKVILDLNCGEPNFRRFLKHKAYYANDINTPDNTSELTLFMHCPDDQIDIPSFLPKPDIIVLFGYGGGEFTGEPLESKTAGESLIRLAKKYRPKYVVVEMCQKWENDFKIMTSLEKELKDYYTIQFVRKIDMGGGHYHLKRLIKIFRIKE